MISVVTIAREYGSGGAELGRLVALKLGWELLDRQLVDRVANIAGLDPEAAARLDEQASRWWRWVVAAGASIASPYPFALSMWSGETDEDSVHALTTQLIQAAADSGGCVIVGRGAQCFLQGRPDVFNVLAYAPLEERIRRLRARQPESADIPPLIKEVDNRRAKYVRHYYRRDWCDKTLYDLCINTALGLEVATELVTTAIKLAKK